jgi:GntR family transcriptional regulator, carbon starvation induced regulator
LVEAEAIPKSDKARTLTATAVEHLRGSILSCRRLPGQRLKLEVLRTDLNIGYSPLREALMQLASEGLVTLEDHRGFIVAPVSIDDLKDVMETRIAIEALVLADALKAGDDHWEAEIAGSFHRLSKLQPVNADHTANDLWFVRHRDFHYSLIAASRSELTKKFWSMAYDRAERYRRLALTYASSARPTIVEHEELMKAAFSRDTALVLRLSEGHIRKTLDILLYDIGARMPILRLNPQ